VSRYFGKRRTAGMVAIMVAAIAGASAYAFTASNTVTAHKSGVGSAAVTGYTVNPTSPSYTFSPDGTAVETVSFDVGAGATDVAASLDSTPDATKWVDCTNAGGTVWSCDFKAGSAPAGGTYTAPLAGKGYPVSADNTLTVAAVSTGFVNIGT
jgi:hypothetical protein